jgi:hypothetical protein
MLRCGWLSGQGEGRFEPEKLNFLRDFFLKTQLIKELGKKTLNPGFLK